MAVINKRIFDTDNALKGSFNGWWGKWQIITYSCFIVSYAIVIGWVYRLPVNFIISCIIIVKLLSEINNFIKEIN